MDDPFGCLRGVESVEHDLYKLTSEMVEKTFKELPRINYCPSCEVQLVNVMNEFCRECPECHRVFEYDDDDQFQEVIPGRSAAPSAHLKNILRKWKIFEMGNGKCYCSISGENRQVSELPLFSAQLF